MSQNTTWAGPGSAANVDRLQPDDEENWANASPRSTAVESRCAPGRCCLPVDDGIADGPIERALPHAVACWSSPAWSSLRHPIRNRRDSRDTESVVDVLVVAGIGFSEALAGRRDPQRPPSMVSSSTTGLNGRLPIRARVLAQTPACRRCCGRREPLFSEARRRCRRRARGTRPTRCVHRARSRRRRPAISVEERGRSGTSSATVVRELAADDDAVVVPVEPFEGAAIAAPIVLLKIAPSLLRLL